MSPLWSVVGLFASLWKVAALGAAVGFWVLRNPRYRAWIVQALQTAFVAPPRPSSSGPSTSRTSQRAGLRWSHIGLVILGLVAAAIAIWRLTRAS